MIPTLWKGISGEIRILSFTMKVLLWSRWLSLSIATRKSTMRIYKKATLKPNANTAWCPNLKYNKNFYALHASVLDLVGWSILTVWSSGISKRSRRHKERDVSNTILKSFSVKCANSNTHNISRSTKKCMKFYPLSSLKEITSLWRHSVRWKDTSLSLKM